MTFTNPTANYPTAVVADNQIGLQTNIETNTLAAIIDSDDLSIVLSNSITGLPSTGIVTIGSERILYISKDDGTKTLTVATGGRGFDGSVAAAHVVGEDVVANIVAYHYNKLLREIQAAQTKIGATGSENFMSNLAVQEDGNALGSRRTVNFISGGGISVTGADNPGQSRVDVTITGAAQLTVKEVDGTPTVASVDTISFNQVDGFTVTDLGGGDVQIGLTGGGSGAPIGADYITKTPNSTLTNEFALSTLTTGLLKVTTATGDLSTAVSGTDYVTPTGIETLSNKTLTTPTIGSFTNATHNHQNAGGGGQLDHGASLTGLSDDDHPQYQLRSEEGASNGYAPLDVSAKVPLANLPTGSGSGLDADTVDGRNPGGASGIATLDASTKVPAAQISEVLALADLNDVTSKTGTGAVVVMQGSPTLTTPVIADYSNANHTHAGVTTGGLVSHTVLNDIGSNTHAAIDNHIASNAAHGATGAVVGTTNVQTLTNKTLTTPTIGDFTNAPHDHSGVVNGGLVSHLNLTNIGTNTHDQIDTHIAGATVHGVSGVVVGTNSTQTLINKTVDSSTNVVRASSLATSGSPVVVSAASAPSAGQVLTATSATAANWQTVSTGGGAGTNATYLTLSNDVTLTDERVLTPGSGLTGTDNGAGSTYVLNVGAGDGITVSADSVAVSSTLAGNGLTYSFGIVDIVPASGSNLTAGADSLDWTGVEIRKAGAVIGTRPTVNFIEGNSNITITTTESVGSDRVDITLTPNLTGAAPDSASYLTTAASGGLSNERVIVAGNGLTSTDAGTDGGNFTIDIVTASGSNLTAASNDLDWTGLTVQQAGTTTGTRPKLNFINGSNISVTTALSSTLDDRVDVTIAATTSTTANVAIRDEGVAQGDASTIDFVGAGVTATVAGGVATVTVSTAGTVTVKESDGTPSVSADTIAFDQANGFSVTDNGSGDVTIGFSTTQFAPTTAQYVTIATDATLANERTLAAGAGLTLTDGGAGAAVTIDVVAASGSNLVANANDLDWTGVTVQENAVTAGTRPKMNFIDGSIATVTVADNAGSDRVDVTVDVPSDAFAPKSATYIVQTANGTLTAEQALGSLATGVLKNTTTTGVLSIAVAGTDYVTPTGTETLTNKTLDSSTNTLRASSLATTGSPVVVSGAAAPTAGQVLTATSATAANWQSPTTGGAPIAAQYLTLAFDGTLTDERLLVAGDGLTLTDGGAGSNATLAVGAGTGITVAADTVTVDQTFSPTWTGTHSFQDTKFFIRDVTDGTKRIKFDVGGNTGVDGTFTTAFTTARTVTFPDATTTVVGTDTTQTLSNKSFTGDISVTRSDATDLLVTLDNTSDTAGVDTTFRLNVGGASAGDPQLQFLIGGTATWTVGVDNSNSDRFKFSASSALGTSDIFELPATPGGTIEFAGSIQAAGLSLTTYLDVSDDVRLCLTGGTLGFFGSTGTTQQVVTNLTDNTGGTANDTLETFDGTLYTTDASIIKNNLADLAAKNNAIIDALQAYGIIG